MRQNGENARKNVYFVQVGFGFDGSVYLPYAVGTLIANCMRYPEIVGAYAFPDIVFYREKLADAMQKIRDPYLVAFSCSVWNIEYNKALARLIRKAYPECTIVFGGHNTGTGPDLLREESSIDILLFGEGEEAFAELLRKLPQGDLHDVPSIAFRENGEAVCTPKLVPGSLHDLPSPYLSGVFDRLFTEYPDMDFLSVLETNRGCPYACAYCDWVNEKNMRFFPMEKVKEEILWLARHKVAYCFCGDSNFGMFPRDLEIAAFLVETKKKYGYPEVFRPCYEKNSADRVFEICSLLNSVQMDKGATLAYQTLCPEALENIGRSNLTMEHFAGLLRKYNEAQIPTYSELILGLPGETYESFSRGICRLLENGQHNSLSVYHCEMLPNSAMADPAYIKKHGIQVIRVSFNHIHSAPKNDEEIREYSYLVRSTATMSPDDWVRANLFSVCVQCFHALGFLRCFAIWLHEENVADYYTFYSGLLQYLLASDGTLGALWREFRRRYDDSLGGEWNYYNPRFGDVTWFFEEGAFLECVDRPEQAFGELMAYLRRFDIPDALFAELLRYQKRILRLPVFDDREEVFSYDFPTYFDKAKKCERSALERRTIHVRVRPRTQVRDLREYAKQIVWFGRRRGLSVYHPDELEVTGEKTGS